MPRPPSIEPPAYVSTWSDLADRLSVSRRCLEMFRNRHAKLIQEKKRELQRGDGRLCVAAWEELAEETGELNGLGTNDPGGDQIDEKALRLRRERFKLDRAEFELARAKQELLPVAEFQAALSELVAAFTAALSQTSGRVTSRIVSLSRSAAIELLRENVDEETFNKAEAALDTAAIEYADIEAAINGELAIVRKTLASCKWLKTDDEAQPPDAPPEEGEPAEQ